MASKELIFYRSAASFPSLFVPWFTTVDFQTSSTHPGEKIPNSETTEYTMRLDNCIFVRLLCDIRITQDLRL